MTAVRITAHVLLRTVALALALVAYDWVYDLIVPPPPDADIGKGLLAFLMLSGIGLGWGVLDGTRTAPLVWASSWVLSGFALAAGWEAWLADANPDQMELGAIIFIAQLVIVPAIVGALAAWAISGRHRETRLAH